MTSETKPISSLTILYDNMRWEEKSLIRVCKKTRNRCDHLNCKILFVDLNEKNITINKIIIQRCVSYFNSLHSTAALEGLGGCVLILISAPQFSR